MDTEKLRPWLVRWMYGVVMAHLLVGMLLPWIAGLSLFDAYHRSVEGGFWPLGAPAAARAQQIWWISLFGPTVQSLSVWMGVLTRIADRQRSAFAWGWLMVGVLVWAPQDMLISLRAGAWIHVWIDCFAVLTMLPPLLLLWRHDRQRLVAPTASETPFFSAPI
ncbi:MAG: cell division protein [Pseudomonadota bacterium]